MMIDSQEAIRRLNKRRDVLKTRKDNALDVDEAVKWSVKRRGMQEAIDVIVQMEREASQSEVDIDRVD